MLTKLDVREPAAASAAWPGVRAGQVAALFGLPRATPLLARTYRMLNRAHPIMLITEWFP